MLRRFLVTLLLAAALTPAVAGAQLYSNGAPNNVTGNEMTAWFQAEDFTLGTSATITNIRFWGFELNANAYQGSIEWRVYGNDAGNPGNVLFSGTSSSGPVNQGPLAQVGLDQLQFDITTNFFLGAGTYWLGLHNGPLTTTDRANFYWQTTGANGTAAGREDAAPFDGAWSVNEQEHAFALNATTSTVPEPGTYALLGTGLFALFVVRRRRRV